MTAGKETGAMLPAPISKLRLVQSYQCCPHTATRTERLPDCHRHHARLMCTICGRFLRWLPRPENVERLRLNGFRIAKLSMKEGLSDWECSFLKSIGGQSKLSPKQQGVLDQLVAKYLSEGTP